MKIVGQSFADSSERFFHGMYLSAQGNPFLDGTALDGSPLAAIMGPYAISLIVALFVAAFLIGSYLYLNRRLVPTPDLMQTS